ncbi:MFS transporter [Candidatus Gottesmanbacteria bacterium]|nr:MFS transporter [Candidatus Gottesmanbacteria bacterium]
MIKPELSPFSALKFRDYRLLWLGLLVSRIGSEMQVVAVTWQMYLLTKSALSLGLIGLARFLPVLFFSLFGGMAADLYNRRKIMIAAQFIMTAVSITLAISTFGGMISPLIIYLLLALNSFATTFDTPSRQAILPSLVPQKYFMNAVSLNTIMWQTAIVVGPSLSGFIIAFLGVGSVYIINIIAFFFVILALFAMNSTQQKMVKTHLFDLSEVKEGLLFVIRTPIIYSTMLLDFFATFFSSATTLLPIFAKDILNVGPQGLGLLYAAPSVGGVLAGLIISSWGHFKNQGKILISTVMVYGLATSFFGLSKFFYLSLFFLFAAGASDVVSTIIRNTLRQLNTPDYIRGRMVSINMIFFMGGPQLGEAEAGILAAAVGTPISVVIGGIGAIISAGLIAIIVPRLRKYQGNEVVV